MIWILDLNFNTMEIHGFTFQQTLTVKLDNLHPLLAYRLIVIPTNDIQSVIRWFDCSVNESPINYGGAKNHLLCCHPVRYWYVLNKSTIGMMMIRQFSMPQSSLIFHHHSWVPTFQGLIFCFQGLIFADSSWILHELPHHRWKTF